MRLSASIMAHPVRESLVDELVASLDRPVAVHWDLAGPPTSQGEQRWNNGVGAWRMYDPDADYHVVIQDDAAVCEDFLAGFEKALERVPNDNAQVVSAYIGSKRPSQMVFTNMARQARFEDASWVRGLKLSWGVAIALRTDTIEPMLEWCSELQGAPYDLRISKYYRDEVNIDCWYTWPCLVDHRQSPSLVAHGDQGRHARSFYQGSALDLAWGGPIIYDRRLKRREILDRRERARGRRYNDSLQTRNRPSPTEHAKTR